MNVNPGVLPLAVLTTAAGEYGRPGFDATTIQAASARVGLRGALVAGAPEAHGKVHLEDSLELDERTRDGDGDAVLHARTNQIGIQPTTTEVCVRGQFGSGGGAKFFGCDRVEVIGWVPAPSWQGAVVTTVEPGLEPEPEPEPELVSVEPASGAVVRGVVPVDELPAFFDRSFSELAEAIGEQGISITGPAYAAYHAPPTTTADLEVGFPTDRPIAAAGSAVAGSLPGGRIGRVVHEGSFDGLGGSWERLMAWIAEQSLTPRMPFWEVYLTEPSPEMDPAELRTELNC